MNTPQSTSLYCRGSLNCTSGCFVSVGYDSDSRGGNDYINLLEEQIRDERCRDAEDAFRNAELYRSQVRRAREDRYRADVLDYGRRRSNKRQRRFL